MAEPLDDDAIERVIRRAQELDGWVDAAGRPVVDEDAVVTAALEMGISSAAVRRSIALERLGPEPEGHRLDRVVGAKAAYAERTVSLDAAEAFERLDDWLTNGHHLRREQRLGTEGVWRKRTDMVASVQRSTRSVSGGASLSTVRLLQAQVVVVDDEHSIVRLIGDRSFGRNASLGAAGGVSAASVAGAAVATTTVSPLAVVVLPGLAVAGVATQLSKRASTKLGQELTRLLDQIDAGVTPASLKSRRFGRR